MAMVKASFEIPPSDSIDARKAAIRDTAAQVAAKMDDPCMALGFKLSAEYACATIDAQNEAKDAGISFRDFMEEVYPNALSSSISTTVANACENKYATIAITKVLMQVIEWAYSKKVDMSVDEVGKRK